MSKRPMVKIPGDIVTLTNDPDRLLLVVQATGDMCVVEDVHGTRTTVARDDLEFTGDPNRAPAVNPQAMVQMIEATGASHRQAEKITSAMSPILFADPDVRAMLAPLRAAMGRAVLHAHRQVVGA